MSDVAGALRIALSETFQFYLEAHFFHWNVEGPTFSQLHELFGDIYEDTFGAVDGIAEHIRALGELAPQTADDLLGSGEISIVPCGGAPAMVAKLEADNKILQITLGMAQACADECGHPEISNYLQERMDRHAKWGWMLKATLGAAENGVTLRQHVMYDHGRA